MLYLSGLNIGDDDTLNSVGVKLVYYQKALHLPFHQKDSGFRFRTQLVFTCSFSQHTLP